MRNGKLMTKRVAAVALSSMMIMSMGMTAFATSGKEFDNTQGPSMGGNIQTGDPTNYLNSIDEMKTIYSDDWDKTTNTGSGKMDSYQKAAFKKTISLYNLLNDSYIPTTPDVHFDYEFHTVHVADDDKNNKEKHTVIRDGKEVKEDVLVHNGVEGVITTPNVTATFTWEDKPSEDYTKDGVNETVIKTVPFGLSETPLQDKDTGIYRYGLIEKGDKTTGKRAIMNDGTRTDITDSVDDIKEAYKGRVVDIVVSKVSPVATDGARAITGVIMRDAEFTVTDDGKWIVKWIDEINKVDGYTPYSMEHYNGKANDEWFTKYTTYDLAIGKEITGTGLNEADSNKEFAFTLYFDMNDNAEAKVYKSSTASVPVDSVHKATAANNGIAMSFTLKGTERFQISGLPLGVKYTLEETDKKGFTKTYYKNDLTNLTRDTDKRFVSQEQTEAFTKLVVGQIGTREEKLDKIAIHKITNVDTDNVQNAFVVNEMQPITITGVVMNVAPYALMVIAAAIFAGLFISKKRQEEEI